ncbi:MAG: hypothetical protein AB8B72_00640 [Crocinitomicaceae bacterium]
MSRYWIQYSIYFLFIVLLQSLVVSHLGISIYAYPMVYILVILVLPFDFNILLTLAIAIILGISVDILSDTFGLHTSAAIFVAYFRPAVLKLLTPRDGYDTTLIPTIQDMGIAWFSAYYILIILLHHIWFFTIEIFRLDLSGLIVLKVIVSALFSILFMTTLQFLLYKSSK